MGTMPLAFSVHNFISSVGADAGFAAIIGLAVLILLYFAHARETANLREEAALLAARLQQAEARVAELSRPQPMSSAVPAAEGVQVTDRRPAGAHTAAPFAPVGMGAPALASATRVVPLPEPEEPEEAQPAAVPAPAAAMAAAPLAAAAASSVAPPPASASPPGGAPPATVPATNGPATELPGPATQAGANGGSRGSAAASPSPARAPASGGTPMRDLPPLAPPAGSRSSLGRRIFFGLASLILVAFVVVALLLLTSSTSTTSSPPHPTQTSNAPSSRPAATFEPSQVTVAVLNGTATNQLAHRVAAKLHASGYKEGRIATASNQTETTTVVAYLPGSKNRTAARHVATALNLKQTAVQPIDQTTQQVACPSPGACGANVVVTVGADLATL